MVGTARIPVAMKVMLITRPPATSAPGNYLKAFDPDHLDGRGCMKTTDDVMATALEAMWIAGGVPWWRTKPTLVLAARAL
jgi:hypothetical protein